MCLAIGLLGLAPSARADLLSVINQVRLQGCPSPAPTRLRAAAPLHEVATRLAEGTSLRPAMTAAGYVAERAAVVHVTGNVGDAELRRALLGRHCGLLSDPDLTDVGVVRDAREAWLVLAHPAHLPAADEQASIGRRLLGSVNAVRAAGRRCGLRWYGPAGPLYQSSALAQAALAHSRNMAAHGRFEHVEVDGSSPATRLTRAGFGDYRVVGENIAAGVMTPAEVLQGWLDSPSHCENIMDPRFTQMGVGFAVNPSSAEVVYWTQDFAAPR